MSRFKSMSQPLKPYFGLSGPSLYRSLAALLILLGNIAASFVMVFINSAFNNLLGALSGSDLTYSIFFGHVGTCLSVITVFATIKVMNLALNSWLGDSLAQAMNRDLINKWIDNKSFYGTKFVESDRKEPVNPANVLGQDVQNIASMTTVLADSFVSQVFSFIVGAHQLWALSVPMTVNVLSLSLVIPGYMFLGAFVYAGAYYGLVSYFDKSLKTNSQNLSSKKDHFVANLHHVHEHGEAIALKQGGKKEKQTMLKNLNDFSKIKANSRVTSSILTFIQVIHNQMNFMLGLALSAPSIIRGHIESTMAFSISSYFSDIVSLFTWYKDNIESISSLSVAHDRLSAFENLMKDWENTHEANKLSVKLSQKFSVNHLTLNKPNGDPLLKNVSFELPVGKITVIQGPSGIGKSTLFRSLAQLWPHVSGELVLPKNKMKETPTVYYIPQKPYFPYRSKLIDAMIYPSDNLSPGQEKLIRDLMVRLNFSKETIDNLHKKGEWDKILSGGEQQRISIIGAIVKKPDILFMDEGTSALDKATKKIAQDCLKQYLRGKTIVAVDHHPLPRERGYQPFFTHTLSMNKRAPESKKAPITLTKYVAK